MGRKSIPLEGNQNGLAQQTVVLVVDEDDASRILVCKVLEAMGILPIACASVAEAMAQLRLTKAECAILSTPADSAVDGASAITQLHRVDERIPVIVTGPASEPSSIMRLVRGGARDFLAAPVEAAALADAVRYQIERRRTLAHGVDTSSRRGRIEKLSARERQILDFVARGYSTKQIAAAIGRVEKTIEFHRHNLMRKLGASNAAQLIHIAMTDAHQQTRSDLG